MTGSTQASLVHLLKKKGTGATMSKDLSSAEVALLTPLFESPEANLTTKATFITALLMLELTADERAWLSAFEKNVGEGAFSEFKWFFDNEPKHPFLRLNKRLIQKESLSAADCHQGFSFVFDQTIGDPWKAVFLEALRLKRETETENRTGYRFLLDKSRHYKTNLPVVIDLSVGYDGLTRSLCLYPFLAPLLASLGFPVVLHGVEEIGPKRGITPSKLLQLAGKNPLDLGLQNLEDPTMGWTYLDQSETFPDLFSLASLRDGMVKRPMLATLEKLLAPVTANQTLLVTSFTHPPYRQTMRYLVDESPFDKGLILRGLEGSIQPSCEKRMPYLVGKKEIEEGFVSPIDYGCLAQSEAEFISGETSLREGLSALSGQGGLGRQTLLYLGKLVLDKLELMTVQEAQVRLSENLDNGLALSHWRRICV